MCVCVCVGDLPCSHLSAEMEVYRENQGKCEVYLLLNDQRCAGSECVKTRPSPSEVRGPSSRYSSGELPSVSLPAPPPAAARDSSAGMVRGGAVPLASGTLERERALPRSPVLSRDPPPPP